jgi:tRNA A-37 threonylcarbamoyl transferase component Bud32
MIPSPRACLGMDHAHNHPMGGERLIPLAKRYRLLSVVGSGGMGTVWRAYDEMLDRDVAVKEVRLPERMTVGERRLMCRRLIDEARATAALRHPGVVALYDVIIEDGRPWLVMELLQARSLAQVICEDGPLPPQRAAEIGSAVLSVLRAAHDAGILHRDVKPSNVLLCDDGRVLLTDFGLAVHMDPGGREIADTLVAGIEGSPAYLPPERVRGETSVQASDMWSLGTMLYAAVEGRSPFLRRHALASMVAVLLGEYEPPLKAGPLRPVIDGLLRDEPDERLSAAETARLLREAQRSGPVPAESGRRRSWRVPNALKRPRLGTVLSVASLAAVVAVVGAWGARWNSIGTSEAKALLPAPAAIQKTSMFHEDDGYSVEVPAGWQRQRVANGVEWTDPTTDQGLRITRSEGDPLTGLRAAEREVAADHAFPGYRKLRLEAAPEIAKDGAEWEFTWKNEHGLRSRAAGYEFYFFAPEARWTPGQRLYDKILESFRPEVN